MIYRHKNKHKLDGVYSNYQGHEKPQKRKEKKGLSLTFKQRTWQNYVIKKQEHKNEK